MELSRDKTKVNKCVLAKSIKTFFKTINYWIGFLSCNLLNGQLLNASSEIEAYKAQFAFSPGSMPSSSSGGIPGTMAAINAFYVAGLNSLDVRGNPLLDNQGKTIPVYPHVRSMANSIIRGY